jgi:hypothetical protein
MHACQAAKLNACVTHPPKHLVRKCRSQPPTRCHRESRPSQYTLYDPHCVGLAACMHGCVVKQGQTIEQQAAELAKYMHIYCTHTHTPWRCTQPWRIWAARPRTTVKSVRHCHVAVRCVANMHHTVSVIEGCRAGKMRAHVPHTHTHTH